jgi:hypothetical protein
MGADGGAGALATAWMPSRAISVSMWAKLSAPRLTDGGAEAEILRLYVCPPTITTSTRAGASAACLSPVRIGAHQ